MTALAWGLVVLATMCAGGLITQMVFARLDRKELDACRDRLDEQETLAATYQSGRDVAVMAHRVTEDQLETERNLRAIAEAQRNEAQRKTRDLLRKHMRTATDDEIRETVSDLFTSPLAVVPRADSGMRPQVPARSEAGPDALIDPFT